ncbi:MAG: transcriptional repressor LexA [Verrucomicrobiota bacterium]
MKELTPRQQEILDFLQQQHQANGSMPSCQEIAGHFGFRSPNAVTEHLRLLRQKGVILREPGKARALRIVTPLQKLRRCVQDIPLYGSIPAGFAEAREQQAEGCVSVDINSVGYQPTRNAFALRVTGESMIGRHILDGDLVILEHGPDPRNGEIVAALIDGESTLKTYVVKQGKPYLKAENPKFPNLIPAQELVIQGVFRALIRPAKV